MRTLLAEPEAVINARPMTYVYDDAESISYPLTPSHLINGRRITKMPNTEYFDVVNTYKTLTIRAQHQKNILHHFTYRWRQEYPTGLREQHTSKAEQQRRPIVSVGDVVIVKNDSTPRNFWKLAVVKELIHGNDGNVRAALVQEANSQRRPRLLRRVIQHLYPIEIRRDDIAQLRRNGP